MRIDFSVPAEFEEVPLGMDFDAACAEVNARSAYGSPRAGTDEQPLTEMARALQRISRFLDNSGVVYAANCLHSFEGEVSLGSLAVSVVDYPYGADAATAARGSLRGVLASRGRAGPGQCSTPPAAKQPSSPVARAMSFLLRSHRPVSRSRYSRLSSTR